MPWPQPEKTLDTNVVVRLLIGDDPQQPPIAEQASSAGAMPVLSLDRRFSASEA